MILKFKDEDEMKDEFLKCIEIMTKLRHYTKEWSMHYGAMLNNKKKYWEQKADEFLESLNKKQK